MKILMLYSLSIHDDLTKLIKPRVKSKKNIQCEHKQLQISQVYYHLFLLFCDIKRESNRNGR